MKGNKLVYKISDSMLVWVSIFSLIVCLDSVFGAEFWNTAPTVDSNTVLLFAFNENEGLKVTNKAGIQALDGMLQPDMKENWTFHDTKFGGALIFDGRKNFVKVSNHEKISSPSQTFEIWCKIDDLEKQHFLLDHRVRAGNGIMLYIESGMLKTTFGTKGELSSSIDSGWHYIAVSYDHKTGIGKLFIDGVEVATSEFAGVDLNADTDLYIGCEDGNSGFFRGVIDEVRISDMSKAPEGVSSLGNNLIVWTSNDAFIDNRFHNQRYDDSGIGIAVGYLPGQFDQRSYLQFDLSFLEPDIKIVSARLEIATTNAEFQTGGILSVKGCSNDWNGPAEGMGDEMTLTWGTKPQTITKELSTLEILPHEGLKRFSSKESSELVSFLNDCLSKDKIASFELAYKSGGYENYFFDREGTGLRHYTGKTNLSPRLVLVLDRPTEVVPARSANKPWPEVKGSFIQASGRDIQEMRNLILNFFPFGVQSSGHASSQERMNLMFKDLVDHNMNFAYLENGVPTKTELAYALNAAKTYNIQIVFLIPGFGLNDDASYNRVRQEGRDVFSHFGKELLSSPNLVGYSIYNEPYMHSMSTLKRRAQICFEEDPLHPALYVAIGLDRIEAAHKVALPRDIFFPDVYAAPNWKSFGDFGDIYRTGIDMLEYLDKALVNFHTQDDTPMWIMLQTHYSQGDIGNREPTNEEIRCMTWQSLAYGAKGLVYFLYETIQEMDGLVDDPEDFDELKDIGAKMAILGPTLLRLKRTTNLAEVKGGGSSSYPAGVVQTLIEDSPFREGAIEVQDKEFTLTKNNVDIKDNDASDDSAVQMANSNSSHDIRWYLKKELDLKPNVEYDLYATIKVDHNISGFNQPQGDAFVMGVYNENKKRDVISDSSVPTDVSTDMVYRDYKIGTFVPEKGQYVYIKGTGNKDIPDIYVDKFFFIEKGDYYVIAVNRNCEKPDVVTVKINNADLGDRYKGRKFEAIDVLNNKLIEIDENKPYQFNLKLEAGDGALVRLKRQGQ